MQEVNPVIEKYRGMAKGGYLAAVKNGYREFTGFPEALKDRYNTSTLFTPESVTHFRDRVMNELVQRGKLLEMDLFLAGRDFPAHTTLLESDLPTELLDLRNKKFATVTDQLSTEPTINTVVGQVITFNDLLVDAGGNIVLVARNIPTLIQAARQKLDLAYQQNELTPRPMDNILHMSVARPTRLSKKQLQYYLLKGLRTSIRKNPLEMQIVSVQTQSAWDLLHSNLT